MLVAFLSSGALPQENNGMEMIMSTNSRMATHRGSADGILRALTSTLKRSCIAYITWRMENIAIAQLRTMSDRELEDIGLTRSDIARTVMGAERSRTHPLLSLRNLNHERTPLPTWHVGQPGGFRGR
jgi:uncharacterized protein YjiS (DUF1127 family)